MSALPTALRRYLWAIYVSGLTLLGYSLWAAIPYLQAGRLTIGTAVLLTACIAVVALGHRVQVIIGESMRQDLSTTAHIALILLCPFPIPVLVACGGRLASQIKGDKRPLYKHAFNVSLTAISVGLCSLCFDHVAAVGAILHPGAIALHAPDLALVIVLYNLIDNAIAVALLGLQDRQHPWAIWTRLYSRTLLPELGSGVVGILAAVSWLYDPALLVIFILPIMALGLSFRSIVQAERRASALRQVLAVGQQVGVQQIPAEILQVVVAAAKELAEAGRVAGYLPHPHDTARFERVVLVPHDALGALPIDIPTPADDEIDARRGAEGWTMRIPITTDSIGVVALLVLEGIADERIKDCRDALSILAHQTAIALDNSRLHEQALARALQDSLTDLPNNRALQTRLVEEVDRARRSGDPLAVLMIDIDGFSGINTTYGHQAGDAVLVAVADLVRGNLRPSDVVARFGADEFAVLLPQSTVDEGEAIATRLTGLIAGLTVVHGGQAVHARASIGIAGVPQHARTADEALRAVDQATYAARRNGHGSVARPEDSALLIARDPNTLAAQLAHANMATVEALASAVDAKDPYTRGHSQRVSAYAAAIAQQLEDMTADDVARVRLAGLLHDVGKIGIPDAILRKPGSLTDEEFATIKQHPTIGESMLAGVPFLQAILPAVRHHHERWDGRGYPDGLSADIIPRDAAVLMVADAFDAMTSTRTYRSALPFVEAQRRIREGSGTQFDPGVVAAFECAVAAGFIVPSIPPSFEATWSREQVA